MSLTLLYRGKNVRFSMKLNKLHWLSALVVFALVSGLIVHLIASADDVPQNPAYLLSSLPTIDNLKVNSQVTAVTMKLAELQSQVLRLNALGDRLAEEASIPDNEFNFQQAPPSGGPMYQADSVKQKSLAELSQGIDTLAETLEHEEKQLKMLESVSFGHHIENTRYLSGRPITKGWLSSYFGLRKDPFNGKPAMHKGVDFAGSENDDIIATASGVVSWASSRYGYGNLIEINHGDGLKTRYGHNKTIAVSVGDVVNKGQVIAKMGSTGRSTGPHVHYEILRNNRQIDPRKYVYRKAK
ncbi:M23 family metallopeptidase [Colwellia sp. MB02u-18]|nr:M23 family metallopeptidase [Colwellia sp. MB3u-45]MBA6268519.1 M23 family metallopeptidase [Colwellia sp. MB3u-43]MBA6297571.1 M23 family metallopeptidase [Colwellia sp. MB02u-9]MBA6319970.1 M23 family metallopeptidase [Colwellia sp. MB02u-19]MBA6324486.1 M23 family metallopeptidase [Colwellia sp. MB02u-18]MBA6330641.1 M23 family metallopeptidase [Colwellia sp. MB02u-12]MBA6346157.1 M23 family metallopeptidase [Colwellia sp. MB02u-1]